jgi:hypothetical protein
MKPPRIRLVLAGAAAVAVALVIGLSVVPATPANRTGSGRVGPPPRSYRGTLVPASGAYLGAYVAPAAYTPASGISAFQSFEKELGGSLEIVHVYHPWGAAFPTPEDRHFVDQGKILLLTWGGDPNTRAIIAGKDDAMIRARAEAVKALGHPIMMEFRHEMDRPNLQWTIHGPADYIAAWDHIRAIFKAVGATNVSWVWCPTGQGFADGRAQPFYPGDNEVDWICADVYSTSASEPLSEAASAFLSWASHHDKPVMIGEFAVGGRPSTWASWLTGAAGLVKSDHQIKALVYFDANGTDSSGNRFFYRLAKQSPALTTFAGLVRQPYFRPVPPNDP